MARRGRAVSFESKNSPGPSCSRTAEWAAKLGLTCLTTAAEGLSSSLKVVLGRSTCGRISMRAMAKSSAAKIVFFAVATIILSSVQNLAAGGLPRQAISGATHKPAMLAIPDRRKAVRLPRAAPPVALRHNADLLQIDYPTAGDIAGSAGRSKRGGHDGVGEREAIGATHARPPSLQIASVSASRKEKKHAR